MAGNNPFLSLWSNPVTHDTLAIGIGAFLGAMSRYQIGQMASNYIANNAKQNHHHHHKLQGWHTALINIGGSFLLGGVTATPLLDSTKASTTSLSSSSTAKTILRRTTSSIQPINRLSFMPKVLQSSTRKTPPSPSVYNFGLTPRTKLLMGVGFCGSFTTFSTFSVDVVNWINAGQIQKATMYVMTNNIGGIVAAATGMILVKKLFGC